MIELSRILKRNNSNIQIFCKKNKLTSYDTLLEYCEQRNFIPCTKKEFEAAIKKDEPKKSSRKNSKAQGDRKPRTSSKRKSNSPKLSKSSDKRKD